MKRSISVGVVLSFLIGALAINVPAFADEPSALKRLNTDAITGLLDVLDILIEENPGYEQVSASLAGTSNSARQVAVAELVHKNAENPLVNGAIDKLVAHPAYELYYAQFNNMTPDIHREILLALPYHDSPQSPAGIGSNLFELCAHRGAVRAWVDDVMPRIDLNSARITSEKWLPPGEYELPQIYFIYDGNGDAFARSGQVVYDLFGLVIGERPEDQRFEDLAGEGVDKIESVLAHELHHVFAARYLYPSGRTFDTWQEQWKDRIVRMIVSEGLAMQCAPVTGWKRTFREDTTIVAYWIGQLRETLAGLDDSTMTSEEMQAWWGASFHDKPRELLQGYARRNHPEVDPQRFMNEHSIDRPSCVYTLGWWMVTRILKTDGGHDKAVGLLSDPYRIFALYDESLGNDAPQLRMDQ